MYVFSLGFLIYRIKTDANGILLLIVVPFLSCLIALARTSCTMLTRNGGSGHFPDVGGKPFNLLSFIVWLTVGFSWMFFNRLRKFHSLPSVLSAFIIKGYWFLSNWDANLFFFFNNEELYFHVTVVVSSSWVLFILLCGKLHWWVDFCIWTTPVFLQ